MHHNNYWYSLVVRNMQTLPLALGTQVQSINMQLLRCILIENRVVQSTAPLEKK